MRDAALSKRLLLEDAVSVDGLNIKIVGEDLKICLVIICLRS